MARYSREELAALVQRELRNALGAHDSEVAQKRLRNLQFYRAEAEGELAAPATPNRSSIVATDVADTVEWMLPALVRVFAQSKDAMQCKPRHPRFVPQAKLCEAYLRRAFWEQNDGFSTLYAWVKDALVQKVGFVKVFWDDEPQDAEEVYRGLTAPQAAELLAEEGVTPLAQSSRIETITPPADPMAPPEMGPPATVEVEVFDLRIQRTTRRGRCRVEAVPPEEMRVHRRARYGGEVPFIAQERYESRGDLEAQGYDLSGIAAGEDWSTEEIERQAVQSPTWTAEGDGELQLYKVAECYIRLDQDKDGVMEWRRILLIGDTVMEDEKADGHPFVAFCPNPESHVFFGSCPADQAIEPQRMNTSLLRGLLDNVYLTVNQRTEVVADQVNLDDLLNNRPGGIVRVKAPGMMRTIDQPGLDQGAWQMVEWGEQWRERRTGFTRYSQGMSPDALNPTATGVGIITEKADQRVELIARVLATSVAQMYRLMLKCMCKYQQAAEVVELMDQWVEVDPREWADGYEVEVDVGLGTGSKDRRAMALQQVYGMQQPLAQMGALPPPALVATGRAFAESVGLGTPEQFFPDPPPPQQPPPPPQVMLKQMELQADAQRFQAETQIEAARMQMQAQLDAQRKAAELEVQRANDERDAARAQMQAEMDAAIQREKLALDRYRADLDAQVRIYLEQMKAAQVPTVTPGADGPLPGVM